MIREVLSLKDLQSVGPEQAAALLLVRQDAGGGEHDDAVFDEWLLADAANAEAWARACSAWQSFDTPVEDDSLQVLREAASSRSPARGRWHFAMAASIALVVATGGALVLNWQGEREQTIAVRDRANVGAEKVMLVTDKGQRKNFTLADASSVTLNTGSAVALEFRPSGPRRLHLLRGQAFFKVAPDQRRPFVVAAGDRTVTALGTAFEVRLDPGTMRIVLVEGRVRVGGTTMADVQLRSGQQLVARGATVTVSAADVTAVGDWQRGVVTFKNTTLAAAASELNRYSKSQLVVDDPRVARLTISGVFRTDDNRRFARAVQEIHPVRIVAGGDTLQVVEATSQKR